MAGLPPGFANPADYAALFRPTPLRSRLHSGVSDASDGLSAHPTELKPILFTAEKTLIRKTLGKLKTQDQAALRTVIETIIG